MTNKDTGKYGEQIAKEFLTKKGFKILEANFRYSRYAEIDLIASKGGVLHFVEVKTRSSLAFGAPQEAVTKSKLQSIFKCAHYYINQNKACPKKIQIDVVAILLTKNENPKIDFIEDVSL